MVFAPFDINISTIDAKSPQIAWFSAELIFLFPLFHTKKETGFAKAFTLAPFEIRSLHIPS